MFLDNGEIHLSPQQAAFTGLASPFKPGEWLFDEWLDTETHLEYVHEKVRSYTGPISVHEQGPVYNHMSQLECRARVFRAIIGYAESVFVDAMEYETYAAANKYC